MTHLWMRHDALNISVCLCALSRIVVVAVAVDIKHLFAANSSTAQIFAAGGVESDMNANAGRKITGATHRVLCYVIIM